MGFPQVRLRRLRRFPGLRRLVQETRLSPEDFIQPLFVRPGKRVRQPIASMPGQFQHSVDELLREAQKIQELKIPAILLFGIPSRKDAQGSEAYARSGIVQVAVEALKRTCPDLVVITDLCFCAYTDHGHCGVVKKHGSRFEIDNDATLTLIAKTALAQARAGADVVAPSGMIDGAVGAIRKALDGAGYQDIAILSYSSKYASAFYGPFRDAAESPPRFGDRKSHQMNPANVQEALREVAQDIEEGADLVMIKPALAYLDVISKIKERFSVPLVAYNVSGEYAMVKLASEKGLMNETAAVEEMLLGIKRAGANLIISYFARDIATRLK